MHKWILLIRGINVGGKNLLPMAELVRDLESLDLQQVKTYIQSGNAVFQATARSARSLEKKISDQLEAQHGFRPRVLVLALDELQTAIDNNPFPQAQVEPRSVHLFFLASKPGSADIKTLTTVKAANERFELDGRVFYLLAPSGIGKSKLASSVERHLGVDATARNWRTVTKLYELANA